jgi:hypothetical protein
MERIRKVLSSTSSSEAGVTKATGRRAVLCAMALLALVGVVLELSGAVGIRRVSRIQRRIDGEYDAATRIHPVMDGKPSLLVLGNSLLLEGIDVPEFQKVTAPEYRASRFVVESTMYRDWYYGIRRLLHAGARPSVILLGLSINHLVLEGVRGEFFARFLMDTRDFPSVVRQEELNPTDASSFLLAKMSGWVGTRIEIRNWLLLKTLPGADQLHSFLQTPGPPPPEAAQLFEIATRRLRDLQQICTPYGVRIVLVIPPSQDIREPFEAVEQAGHQLGVPVLVSYHPGEMPVQDYRDGYHLNEEGAILFTRRLGAQLLNLHLITANQPPASGASVVSP